IMVDPNGFLITIGSLYISTIQTTKRSKGLKCKRRADNVEFRSTRHREKSMTGTPARALIVLFFTVLVASCDDGSSTAVSASNTKPDFSTPQAARLSLATAISAGDATSARAALAEPEKYSPLIDALTAQAASMRRLGAASAKQFGSAGKS